MSDVTATPATFAAVLAGLPALLEGTTTVTLAAGAYPDPLEVTRFYGPGTLRVIGVPGAVLAGSVTDTARGMSFTASVLVRGPVQLDLVGLTVAGIVGHGIWAHGLSRLRLTDVTVAGATDKGIAVWDGASLEIGGVVRVTGFASRGVQIGFGSRGTFAGPGTLSIMGNGIGWGLHVVDTSHFVVHAQQPAGCNVEVDACETAIAIGLNALYNHQGPGGETILEDCAGGALATDCSSWATTRPLTYRRVARPTNINSVSYYEDAGSTLTDVGELNPAPPPPPPPPPPDPPPGGPEPMHITLYTNDGGSGQHANLPAGVTEFWNNTLHRAAASWAGMTQARVHGVVKVLGAPGCKVGIQYSADQGATWDYLDGVGGSAIPMTTYGLTSSPWVTLAQAAQGDVWLRPVGIDGNGVADPGLGSLYVEVR